MEHPETMELPETMGDPAALFDLGNRLFTVGDSDAAVEAFRQCLLMAPNHAGASFNLGNALVNAARPVDAVAAFVACLRAAPDFAPAYVNLASTLRRLTLLDAAQSMAEAAVQLLPTEPEAKICLASVLHDRGDHAAAVALYRQALIAAPGHAGARSSLGNSLLAMGRGPEALAEHDLAIAAAPHDPDVRFSRAAALLAVGDFRVGWQEHEWRWRRTAHPGRGFGAPWAGEDISGRTILLHAEQGLGDTLQFVRYAPLVAARGAHVVLEVQPPLVRLLRRMPGIGCVIGRGDSLPAFDGHCPLMSLPLAFATTLETIPASVPYLTADAVQAAAWDARLPDDGALRVGLVWAGSPHPGDAGAHLIDRRRSIALADLVSLGQIAGVRLVSLQKDHATTGAFGLIELMAEVADFADTAALIVNLDLVISVDTSVAHLAGALGRPVWLLSRYDACWRWLNGRTNSPWYPSMRIYQQDRPLDWSFAIERVRADLMALAGAAGR